MQIECNNYCPVTVVALAGFYVFIIVTTWLLWVPDTAMCIILSNGYIRSVILCCHLQY